MKWDQAGGRVLIVGASGQVGAAMCRLLRETGREAMVLPAARTPCEGSVTLDLAELREAETLLAREELSAVLCIAGWTHVDACEADPARAMQVNATGPAVLAKYAWRRRVPFVYYSTDYLFDGAFGTPGPYAEDAAVDPLNVYGTTKLAGEERVMEEHPEALILRTSWVFGEDVQAKNFVYQVLQRLTLGQEVRVPEDQSSTPAYNVDLARATFALLERGAGGVYNACGPDVLSRLEFARTIAGQFGFGVEGIAGVKTEVLRQPARRPLLAGLDSEKLGRECPEARMRGVVEALNDCRPALERSIAQWRSGVVAAA